jgi:hypothetical protein
MVSYRKKYSPQVESHPARDDDAPVAASPRPSAAAPPPAVEHPDPPALEERPPEETAAKNAIQERLAEMREAEQHAHESVHAPHAPEPQRQQQPEMPASVQKWLAEHPQYMNPNDPIAAAEINLAAMKCVREGLTWDDDKFLPSMERHLGIAPSNGKHLPASEPASPPRAPMPAPRQPAPQRFASGQPPAAPPSREGYGFI